MTWVNQMTQKDCILTKILGCGSSDLEILEDINYDLDEIIDELQTEGCLSFTELIRAVFYKGIDELKDKVQEYLQDLWNELKEGDDAEIQKSIDEIETLNPEEDVEFFINYLDTHIYFNNYEKEEIYHRYFEKEISCIEDKIGFSF